MSERGRKGSPLAHTTLQNKLLLRFILKTSLRSPRGTAKDLPISSNIMKIAFRGPPRTVTPPVFTSVKPIAYWVNFENCKENCFLWRSPPPLYPCTASRDPDLTVCSVSTATFSLFSCPHATDLSENLHACSSMHYIFEKTRAKSTMTLLALTLSGQRMKNIFATWPVSIPGVSLV